MKASSIWHAKSWKAALCVVGLCFSFGLWAAPVIRQVGFDANSNAGQISSWIAIQGENFDGITTNVFFAANGGGTVAATNVFNSTGRGLIICQIPSAAVTGDVVVQVDGASSSGYPVTILSGTFDPGANTISGQITDGGTPVSNVAVALIVTGSCNRGQATFWTTAATDASGFYSLDWPGSGSNYTVFVLPPRSTGLATTAAPVSGTGNITQDFALTAGTTVTGTIEDPTGAALQNAFVSFDGAGHNQVLTDASGNFTLHLAPGSWDMSVDPPVGAHARNISQVSVTVPASSPYSLGTQALQGGIWVSGTLEDDSPTPQPVVAADIMATPANGGPDMDEVLSRPGGTFGVEVDPGATFHLSVQTARTGPLADWQQNYGPYSADTALGTIQISHAGFITGVVTDESSTPVSQLSIAAFDTATNNYLAGTQTCSDGSYTLKVPSAGTILNVYVSTILDNDSRPYAEQTYNDKIFQCEGDAVTVPGTATVSGINFTLHPGGSISGVVSTSSGGTPVAGIYVQADDGGIHNCSLGGQTPTDASGNYQLDHLPIIPLRIWASNAGPTYSEGSYSNKIFPDYNPVTPTAGATTPNININLSAPVAPTVVPNGTNGTQPVKITKNNADASSVTATWDVTSCPPPTNHDYSVVAGAGSTLSSYQVGGGLCDIGTSGTFTGPMPAVPSGEHFLWFVIVQTGGSGQTESSWGLNSSGQERNGTTASGQCQDTYKDTSSTCP